MSETEAHTIADLARKAHGEARIIKTADDRELLVMPEGFRHHDVTPPHKLPILKPDHIRQQITVQTADSLIEYIERFKIEDTVLLADIT